MKIGITLPQMGLDASPATITAIAQEAERLDFASVWVGERLLRPRHFVAYGGRSGPIRVLRWLARSTRSMKTYNDLRVWVSGMYSMI